MRLVEKQANGKASVMCMIVVVVLSVQYVCLN